MTRLAAAILTVAFSLAAFAELPLRGREKEAFEYLKKADQFQMPFIGFAAAPSPGFLAMRIVARSKHADAAFKELVATGTSAGQLYGLVGVQRTDRAWFDSAVKRYARNTDEVGVFSGCVIGGERVADLVKGSIATGQYTRMFLDASSREREVRAAEKKVDFRR